MRQGFVVNLRNIKRSPARLNRPAIFGVSVFLSFVLPCTYNSAAISMVPVERMIVVPLIALVSSLVFGRRISSICCEDNSFLLSIHLFQRVMKELTIAVCVLLELIIGDHRSVFADGLFKVCHIAPVLYTFSALSLKIFTPVICVSAIPPQKLPPRLSRVSATTTHPSATRDRTKLLSF